MLVENTTYLSEEENEGAKYEWCRSLLIIDVHMITLLPSQTIVGSTRVNHSLIAYYSLQCVLFDLSVNHTVV
jgi:hypothetical protein